jgi:hypothetical protein
MAPDDTARPRIDPLAMARAAGLHEAVDRFPDDVVAAARAAAQDLADLPAVDGTAEPWPPMRAGGSR